VDEFAVADVDADMGDASPTRRVAEKDQIAGAQLPFGHGRAHVEQFRCRPRRSDAVTAQQKGNEARTIKPTRRRIAPVTVTPTQIAPSGVGKGRG
jgi:hypothetical protein